MQQVTKAPEPAAPASNEFDPYYQKYIGLIPEHELFSVLGSQSAALEATVGGLAEERGGFAYDEGKWSIKEVLSHLIDGERMFMYRAFRIARGDKTPLEGFEQDGYIENSHANDRTFADLTTEFRLLREANLHQFRNLDGNDWLQIGTANSAAISVRALAFIMAGHIEHHLKILRERYLA